MSPEIMIRDCTPAMADVVAGIVPCPHERGARENAFQWLKASPVMATLTREFPEFGMHWPTINYRTDIALPASLGLADFPHVYTMIWEAPPAAHSYLLAVNVDGTRFALIDTVAALTEAWAKLNRAGTGRPRAANPSRRALKMRASRGDAEAARILAVTASKN